MRSMKINQEWDFGLGQVDLGQRIRGIFGDRTVSAESLARPKSACK